jgi:hypothetical protein
LDYPLNVADEYVACPELEDAQAFAARVVGDSMGPTYREGDVVVFSPAAAVTDGCDCFVRLEPDHETTFKRVFFEGGDGSGPPPLREGQGEGEVARENEGGAGERKRQKAAADHPHPGLMDAQDDAGAERKAAADHPHPSPLPQGRGSPMHATHIRLQPLNPAFAARVVRREQVSGLWRAVWRLQRL